MILPPLVAGAAGDVALRRLDLHRPGVLHGFAVVLALLLWTAHFVAMAIAIGLRWPPELWGGAIGMSVLTAVGLAVLAQPIQPVTSPDPASTPRPAGTRL